MEEEVKEDPDKTIAAYELSYQNSKDENLEDTDSLQLKFRKQLDSLIQYVWKNLFYKPKRKAERLESDSDDDFTEVLAK